MNKLFTGGNFKIQAQDGALGDLKNESHFLKKVTFIDLASWINLLEKIIRLLSTLNNV